MESLEVTLSWGGSGHGIGKTEMSRLKSCQVGS